MKIKKVEIEGFRAYKYKQDGTFDFTIDGDKPSNFVAIYAPNGFGKSSFYDAVEWAVTNHLERLGGDYNRKNLEFAAKSTKEDGVGQKILRNKDVADNVITHVKVSTTRSIPFDRKIKGIRSDSRDIRIGDNKKKENEYFRKVILSQDEIDRFLKEAKPQDRYKRFMESFGGDAELARQELTALIHDNKAVLNDLEKKRDELEEQLQEPVDVSVFEQFNLIASELNVDGENIPLVDQDFSVHTEHEILSFLVTRAHELEVLREARAMSRESLVERLSRLPEVQLNLDLIAEQQPQLVKLSKGVVDAQGYQALLASHAKCLSDLQAANQQLEKLLEVNGLVQDFLHTEAEITTATRQQKTFAKQRADEAALLDGLEQSAKQQKDNLATADARSLILRNAVDNCGPTYSEIVTHQGRLVILDSQIVEKDVTLSLDKSHRDSVKAELAKVSDIKVSVQSLLTSDVSAINFDKQKLQELGEFAEELNVLELHDQTIRTTQNSLNEQMGLHERLIATGLEYLSLWPTSTCPLCHKPHDSVSALKEEVEGNNLLSSLSKENSQKLEASAKLQSELKAKMESIVRNALAIQMQRLAELRQKLNDLGIRISRTEQEKSTLSAEKQSLEAQIKSLQEAVWGLAKDDLIQRAEAELRGLAVKRGEYLVQQSELNRQIEVKKSLIAAHDSSIKVLNLRVEAMAANSTYQKVGSYLKENGLSSDELKAHCSEKLLELERLKEERRADANQTVDQCKVLHDGMLADGTWVDFATLAAQKEQVEHQITKSKSLVESFFETINRMVGPQVDKSIDGVKDNISKAIDTIILQYQGFDNKRKKVELLSELLKAFKPYLTSLSLRETLADVERNLLQRRRIDTALSGEQDLVVAELRKLINTFFHEDLINSIYRKIDPHPSFKKVEFRPDFESSDRPGLNIVLNDEAGESISPILYFSAAQLNILSLSVFLASALHAKDDDGAPLDVIMIDDPIQSMDSINVLATIDLLRSISVRFDKQIIISTHDDNFFGLLQRKIPSEVLGSKFLKLEKFGVVVPVEPLVN